MIETLREARSETDAISVRVDDQGIGWVTFDRPGAKVNVLSSGVMRRLDEVIGELQDAASSGKIRSAVI